MAIKTIAIGNDHGGTELKFEIVKRLEASGYKVINKGTDTTESVDYPDMAKLVCDEVNAGNADCGILICGTGIGIGIAANKVKGIRAAMCSDCFSAKMARVHNNANVITFGARTIGPELAWSIVESYLSAEFEGGRHETRVNKIMELENL